MNNNPNQTRTPNGQQNRPQTGQRPPMQGQRPPMQGQRPPMQGQRPPMQGQRPPMQGQRPPMNGPQNRRPAPKKSNKTLIIALVSILVIAIIGGLVAMTIALVNNSNGPDTTSTGGGSSSGKKPGGSKPPADNGPEVSYSITLPSATQSGNYLSGISSDCENIEGISSAAAVLVDVNANTCIAQKNADTKIHPASMTKVMTLIVACENISKPGRLLTVEQWMVDYAIANGGSGVMAFKAGEQISVESALYLISNTSDTIACLLISKYLAGDEKSFADMMNAKANQLGLTQTHFVNSTGLDIIGQSDYNYTTCREMAAIMNCAMNNPVVKDLLTSRSHGIPIYVDGEQTRSGIAYSSWIGKDRLDNQPKISGTSLEVLGGKTGWETIPRACFVTAAQDASTGKQYICVVVGRITPDQAEVKEAQSTTDTRTIYKNYAK